MYRTVDWSDRISSSIGNCIRVPQLRPRMHRGRPQAVVAVIAVVCLYPLVTSAQQAQLSGVIQDAQAAPITAAEAKLTEATTGVVITTRSNEGGAYVFASVKPGNYRLEVTADGFAKYSRGEFELHVDQRAILNITLSVGSRREEVTVAGARPLLGLADGSLGTVIDRRLAENLPLRGRSFSSLVSLVPGVVSASASSSDGSEFRVNGQRSSSNTLTVDGVSAPSEMGVSGYQTAGGQRFATTVTGTINGGISMDAVQEIHVQTSTFAAEFGRTPGAQISLITRSGTNRLRGSVFEQFRNDNMSANDWFANSSNQAKPSSEEHQFGAAAGGPLVRSKLFFFASYEGLRLDRPFFTKENVPSIEARQVSSVVRGALNVYPVPTGPTRADGTAEFASFIPLRFRSDTWGVRLDQALKNVQLFGRYSRVPSTQDTDSPFSGDAHVDQSSQNVTAGMTATLGPRTLVEVRGNYTDSNYFTISQTALRDYFPDSVPEKTWIQFSGTGLSTIFTGNRLNNIQRQGNTIGSLSHARGSHQTKVGVDHRRVWPKDNEAYRLTLRFASLAQALVGATGTLGVQYFVPTNATFQSTSLYAQDQWKVHPRLSLMLGLRWDVNPAPKFRDEQGPLAVATFEPLSALKMTTSRNVPLWRTDYSGFFPRLGFSYSLDPEGRTLLTGGVGRFGDLDVSAAGLAAASAAGASTLLTTPNVALPLTSQTVQPLLTPSLTPPFGGTVFVVDPNLGSPRTTQWNVTVQRALGARHDVSASYVGAHGEDLLQNQRYGPGLAQDFTGTVIAVTNGGCSRYQSMQVRYRGHPIAGLDGLASYTLADAKETESRLNAGVLRSPMLRPSDSDVRHIVNAAVTWMLPDVGSGPVAQIWKGWALHFVATARSGFPFSVRSTDFTSLPGQEVLPERFASLVPGVPIVLEDASAPSGTRYNKAAFVNPPAGEQGDTTLNQFRGFGARQVDLGLQRSLSLPSTAKVRVRIDAFNLFNTPTFGQPVGTLNNANFGVPTGMRTSGLTSLYRTGGPRTLAVSIRFEY